MEEMYRALGEANADSTDQSEDSRIWNRANGGKTGFTCSEYATFPFSIFYSSENFGKLLVGTKFYTFSAGHLVGTIIKLRKRVLKPDHKRATQVDEKCPY